MRLSRFAASCTSIAALALAPAARAWEPHDGAAIASRLDELHAAFKGMPPPLAAQAKVERAKQPKPAWADKTSFKVEGGGRSFTLGVGLQKSLPDPAGTLMVAESKARAAVLSTKGGATTQQETPGQLKTTTHGRTTAEGLDWWLSPEGVVYALVAEDAAAAEASPAPAPAPK